MAIPGCCRLNIFVLRVVGSAIVVILTGSEDFKMLFMKDEKTTQTRND
jgi:hypothetical protein